MDDLFDALARHVEAGLQARDPVERDYHMRHALQYIEELEAKGVVARATDGSSGAGSPRRAG